MEHVTLQDLPGHAPSRLRWGVDAGVLVVEFHGRRHSPAHMAGCWHAVKRLAEAQGLVRVLAIDRMDDEPLTGEQRRDFIAHLGQEFLQGRRWAYVARSIDRVGAYEATQLDALELGIEVRVFASRAEADLWVRFPG